MSVSGRLSSCSVEQEENLVKKMHKTPGTPIKAGYQTTPRKSESKRCLFQVNSPIGSDLGMSPVSSPSSCSSARSPTSPHFSPNGTFSTPPRTPRTTRMPTRASSRIALKKIEVKSSLFPDLKLHTPKLHHTARTPQTLLSKMLTPQSKVDSLEDIQEGFRSWSTPPTSRSFRQKQTHESSFVAESPSGESVAQDSDEESPVPKSSVQTKLGVKPLSSESFYGPVPEVPKGVTKLLRPAPKDLLRWSSRDSLSSSRSFVKGGSHGRTVSGGSHQSRRSRSQGGRRRAPHAGVWHNIKKPKQMKKMTKNEKPLISPKSRLAKMLNCPSHTEIKVKSKPLFQDCPRKRVAKRPRSDTEDDGIIDSFPGRLIKRKKLPTSRQNAHPAMHQPRAMSPEILTPDPNKKFLKYGHSRKATFTLNDNVKLRITDGVMKLQTPKKRRKLYSKRDYVVEDFNDFGDEADSDVQRSIEGILSILQSEKEVEKEDRGALLLEDSEGQKTKVTPVKATAKGQRSPLKSVSNLPTLILNDFESDDNEEQSPVKTNAEKSPSEVSLAKTGTMVSYLTNILVNSDQDEGAGLAKAEEVENSPPVGGEKLYPLFYRRNWSKALPPSEAKAHSSKRRSLVPDDQYLLDAGQKSVGIVTCKKCGVMYQAGDFADEATHSNFHNHLSELRFTGWSNERVVGRYGDERVIMVLGADPKMWWQKVSKVLDIVDQELGFPEASLQSLHYKTVYLYINEKAKQVAGCLIAEECREAYRMFPPLEGVEIDSCSKEPSPCKVGISRIWTALSHRRKGVASRLIDCLQRTFLFGEIVSLDHVAFSVPSPLGKLLAQKVTGRFDFLVYGFA